MYNAINKDTRFVMRSAILGAWLLSAGAACAQSVPAAAPQFVSVSEASSLTSNLVGLKVTNAGGESIGEIKDVVMTADKGVAGFIVSVGGFLGLGERYVVVDPTAVAVSYNGADQKWHAKMNATADQLKAAPVFKYEGKWKS